MHLLWQSSRFLDIKKGEVFTSPFNNTINLIINDVDLNV